jgi:hypothetical protein
VTAIPQPVAPLTTRQPTRRSDEFTAPEPSISPTVKENLKMGKIRFRSELQRRGPAAAVVLDDAQVAIVGEGRSGSRSSRP